LIATVIATAAATDSDRRHLALQISDLDPGGGILTIRRGKFSKARLLPLHPATTAALGEPTA